MQSSACSGQGHTEAVEPAASLHAHSQSCLRSACEKTRRRQPLCSRPRGALLSSCLSLRRGLAFFRECVVVPSLHRFFFSRLIFKYITRKVRVPASLPVYGPDTFSPFPTESLMVRCRRPSGSLERMGKAWSNLCPLQDTLVQACGPLKICQTTL